MSYLTGGRGMRLDPPKSPQTGDTRQWVRSLLHHAVSSEMLSTAPAPISPAAASAAPSAAALAALKALTKLLHDGRATHPVGEDAPGTTEQWRGQLLGVLGNASEGCVRPVCGYMFKANDICYNCLDCQADPTCVICQDCFDRSDHTGHQVRETRECDRVEPPS